MDEFFIRLMEVIEKNVMLKVYNEFNALFQNWFSILMEEETISARLDDTFTPVVEVNGYEMPLESLSGGEKTSCAPPLARVRTTPSKSWSFCAQEGL